MSLLKFFSNHHNFDNVSDKELSKLSLEHISDALVMKKWAVVRVPEEDTHKSIWNCTNCLKSLIAFSLALVLLPAASGGWYYWVFNMYDTSSEKLVKLQLHSLLMTIGFITVNGFSIISFRICKCLLRWNITLAHWLMQTIVLIVMCFGGYEAFMYHDVSQLGHFISLHGQVGTLTVILFSAQYLMGIFTFICLLICEKDSDTVRADFIPFHAALGRTIFLLSVTSWMTGLAQTAFWITDNMSPITEERIATVACCWLIILLAVVCMYILTTERLRYTSHIGQNTGD